MKATTTLVKFSVEQAESLEELVREAEATARATVETSLEAKFHSATIVSLTTGFQGDFTYELPATK